VQFPIVCPCFRSVPQSPPNRQWLSIAIDAGAIRIHGISRRRRGELVWLLLNALIVPTPNSGGGSQLRGPRVIQVLCEGPNDSTSDSLIILAALMTFAMPDETIRRYTIQPSRALEFRSHFIFSCNDRNLHRACSGCAPINSVLKTSRNLIPMKS
jgi:hypothetical protein